jgi:hypothetical protein
MIMILLVDGYSAILPFVESGLYNGRFESSSISLHASYLILILFNWHDAILEYFWNQKNKVWHYGIAKQIDHLSTRGRRRTTWSDGYMVHQWVTQGTRRSIDNARRPGRGSMMRPNINEESDCLRKKNLRWRLVAAQSDISRMFFFKSWQLCI